MFHLKVFPAKPSSLSLKHPTHGPLTADGAIWPHDSYTSRRISDGSVTTVLREPPATVVEPKPVEAKPAPAPAEAKPASAPVEKTSEEPVKASDKGSAE